MTRSRLSRTRTQGTWEANGTWVQTPPKAVVEEAVAAKGVHIGRVYVCQTEYAEDAAFIALAVNCHDDLVAGIEKWLAHYDDYVRESHLGDETGIPELRAALAKARGE